MPTAAPSTSCAPITIERGWSAHAEGSALISFGGTKVLCTASFTNGVPRWLTGKGKGWVTAEYAMLPRATNSRNDRESVKGKIGGRTHEISRLIGRALRAVVDTKALGENTIVIDCDVLQADGGTRTAAITGAYVALADAIEWGRAKKFIGQKAMPLIDSVAAVSVGIIDGEPMLDLAYVEDVRAETDMNVVVTGRGLFVEVQGTAEGAPFDKRELDALLELGVAGCASLREHQLAALAAGAEESGVTHRDDGIGDRGGRALASSTSRVRARSCSRPTTGTRSRSSRRSSPRRAPTSRSIVVRRPRAGRGRRDLRRERAHQGARRRRAHRPPGARRRLRHLRRRARRCARRVLGLLGRTREGCRGQPESAARPALRHRDPHRTAQFVSTIALVVPGDASSEQVVEGRWPGRLATAASGEGGFGYDPIFIPDGQPDDAERTVGEWSAAEKNADSHRARAFAELVPLLAEL